MLSGKTKLAEQITALQGDIEAKDAKIAELEQAAIQSKEDLATVSAERDTLAEQVEGAIDPEAHAELAGQVEALASERDEAVAGLKAAGEKLELKVLADASEGDEAVADGGEGDGSTILDEWNKVRGTKDAHAFWQANKTDILAVGQG